MPLVVNLQRKIKFDITPAKEFVSSLATAVDEAAGSEFSVALVSDRRMKELNGFFRGNDSTTDVLSFPHETDDFDNDDTNLGDIVISVEQAQRQAKENKLTLANEINQLILHGVLHLCGYDHETDKGEMNKRELQLRRQLGI
jgi:probable rRNA maturation factor